ncbi:MAG: hypothetical protein ACRDIF_07310, partial [Actinomycetota bacterium]
MEVVDRKTETAATSLPVRPPRAWPYSLMALVFLSALAAGVFRHHLFAGYTFPWDFASGFGRVPVFVTSTFGSGRFTEWNPFGAGGMPIAWN